MKSWKILLCVFVIGLLSTSTALAESGDEAVFASDAYAVDLFNTVKMSGSRFITGDSWRNTLGDPSAPSVSGNDFPVLAASSPITMLAGSGYGQVGNFTTEPIIIWVTPADTLLRGNQSFTYTVRVANVYPGMRGYEVKISLNDSAFSSIVFTEGAFLSSTSDPTHWELLEDGGDYTVNCSILGVTDGKTGDGILFTIAATTDMPVPDNLVSTIGNNFLLSSVKFRDVVNHAISVDSIGHGKIVVDTGRPTMETINEVQEVWYRNVPKFSNFGFDDNYNLDKVEYKIDLDSWKTIASNINSTQYNNDGWLIPGFDKLDEQTALHTIYWRAYDDAGNYDGYHEFSNDALNKLSTKSGQSIEALKPDLNFWKWTFKKDITIPQGDLTIYINNVTTTSMHVNAASVEDATQGEEYYHFECTTDGRFNRSRAKDDSVHECTGLTPNHIYEFIYRVSDGVNDPNSTPAYNQSDWSPVSSKHTLSVPPSTLNLTCVRSGDNASTTLTLTAVGGFGEGTLEYYRYALVNSDSYNWTGQETKWSQGLLQLGIPTAGTDYYVFVKGYNGDDVANGTLRFGPYRWDGTPIEPVTGLDFGAADDSTNGFHLDWTNPDLDAFYIQVWVIGFGGYPEYNGQTPDLPTTPAEALANGWTKIFEGFVTSLDYTPPLRDFYYCAIFVQDLAFHYSAAVLDSSLSYWLGDIDPDGDVDAADIAILAAAYFTSDGFIHWNNLCDVGPTLNHFTDGRPTPDNIIDFEDLMIFAMNYENMGGRKGLTKKQSSEKMAPISLNMSLTKQTTTLIAEVQLAENSGAIKGMSIPVNFGAGLALQSVERGSIWKETDFFMTNSQVSSLSIDGAALGNPGVMLGTGVIAKLEFAIVGEDTEIQFGNAIVRSTDNSDIEIGYSYTAITLEARNEIPTEYRLHQNYPNPFNPSTTIQYDLKEAGLVKISLYNVNGQKMDTIFEGAKDAGYHSVVFDASELSSGVYIYRIEVNDFSEMQKMILVK
ncbi:MAG: T9SS type A sorting domain-containing protein [Candidatus Zhuqueibacterota bacterium]